MPDALLIVDLQTALFAQAPYPHDLNGVITRINELAKRARSAGVQVIFVQHEGQGLENGSAGWQIDSRVKVEAGDLNIHKNTSAPYASTPLQAILNQHGVKQLAIAGYSSEFCIDSTVRWSASLGFEVVLVSDGHCSHDKPHLSGQQIIEHHNATLPAISSLGAKITAAPAASLWAL
ncbi:isochorismatase family protein [Iodobacter sp. CM08]|uniref:isochorismatase family protein n=1 Tax=Iodobacter sp. CM08 TaxID=3085902 RepID=UPI0029823337|nr:isochorismatase family protein [Iodobacter sp. CM08]MDW5418842.1 isochorismatase family protein [Iodobacter sp. CM08]